MIEKINNLMRDFIRSWEEQNTNEVFMDLSGSNFTTEMQLSIKTNNERLKEIEDLINSKDNQEELVDNWSLLDWKILDTLIDFYEMDVKEFLSNLKQVETTEEIRLFIEEQK